MRNSYEKQDLAYTDRYDRLLADGCRIHTKRLILLLILLVGTVLDMIFYRSDSVLPCCSIAGLIV